MDKTVTPRKIIHRMLFILFIIIIYFLLFILFIYYRRLNLVQNLQKILEKTLDDFRWEFCLQQQKFTLRKNKMSRLLYNWYKNF